MLFWNFVAKIGGQLRYTCEQNTPILACISFLCELNFRRRKLDFGLAKPKHVPKHSYPKVVTWGVPWDLKMSCGLDYQRPKKIQGICTWLITSLPFPIPAVCWHLLSHVQKTYMFCQPHTHGRAKWAGWWHREGPSKLLAWKPPTSPHLGSKSCERDTLMYFNSETG